MKKDIHSEIERLEKENDRLTKEVAKGLVEIHTGDLKWLKNKKD